MLNADHYHTRPGQKHLRVNPLWNNSKTKRASPPAALPPATARRCLKRLVHQRALPKCLTQLHISGNKVPQAEHLQSQLQKGELREGKTEISTQKK